MGTITERKKRLTNTLSYRAEVRIQGVRQTKTFDRKTDARDWIQKIEQAIKRGERSFQLKHYTLSEAIERYCIECLPLKRPGTQETHITQLRWWKENFGSLRITSLSNADLSKARELLKTQDVQVGIHKIIKRSPSTVNRYFQVLMHLLNTACHEWQWINTVPRLKKLAEPRGRTRFLTPEEIRLILIELEEAPAEVQMVSAISMRLGSRLEETCALRWRDIDFSNRLITFSKTKSGKIKTLPMPEGLYGLLMEWKDSQPPQYSDEAYEVADPDYVFPSSPANKIPYVYETVRKGFRAITRKLGLEDVTFHNLRHTVASWATQRGTNRKVVADILGHEQVNTTDRYSHLAVDHMRPVVEMIERELEER